MEEPIVIHTGYGGLGDNLMFSTLPEAFNNHGYEEIYISSRNRYRNREIKELIWDDNPYIVGESDFEPNAGFIHTGNPYTPQHDTFIRSVEIANGVDMESELPKLYGSYPFIEDVCNKALVDLTVITRENDYPNNIQEIVIKDLITADVFDEDTVLFVKFENVKSTNYLKDHGNYKYITVSDIFTYVSLIQSCLTYVSLHSGGNMLAIAVRDSTPIDPQPIVCYIPKSLYTHLENNGNQALFPGHCKYRFV